jgi:hypothetical protein
MASFKDTIPQFNPYIQQLPVEAMVQVGMEKQQRYDQGLQKIQSQIDQVAGLSLYRDADKQQLQSKLNELGSKLKTVAAADFSNYQLVNSVAGMASTIMKDPVVLAGVQSTQNIKNNEKIMEEARQKGELTPDNLDFYNKKLAAYDSAGLVDERGKPIVFGAKYVPHFDVEKYARETFNAIKPSNMTWDEVFTQDVNGNTVYSPVMLRMEKEGIFPEVVKQTIDQIFSDPRVAQQLQITGEYNYKGQDANSLKTMLVGQQDFKIAEVNNEIQDLTLKKNATENLEEKTKIDTQIKNLQDLVPKIKNNYAGLMEAADSNTEALRGYLYENDVRGRYTSMFGYMKTKQSREQDPMWKAQFDIDNEKWKRQDSNRKFAYQVQRDSITDAREREKLDLEKKKIDLENARNTLGKDFELGNVESTYDAVATHYTNYENASQAYSSSSNELLYRAYYSTDSQQKSRLQGLISRGSTREEAISAMIEQDAKASGVDITTFRTNKINEAVGTLTRKGPGNIPQDLSDAISVYTRSKQVFNNAKIVKDELDKVDNGVLNQTLGKLYESDEIKPKTVKFRGQDIALSKQDIIDMGVYLRGYKHVFGFAIDDTAREAANAAEARLNSTGKGPLLESMLRNQTIYGEPVTEVVRQFSSPFAGIADVWYGDVINFEDLGVGKVFRAINNSSYSEGLQKKKDIGQRFTTPPTLSGSIITGKAETDRFILSDLKRVSANYKDVGNVSSDYEEFIDYVSGIKDASDLNVGSRVTYSPSGEPMVEIIAYGEGGSRVGGIMLQPDEADNFIDTSNLYVSQEQLMAENAMIARGSNSTSYGDPDDLETYLSRDAEFQKIRGDFPMLQGLSDYDVMGNIVNLNGRYYGKVFVHDTLNGTKYPVFTTDGYDFPTIYNTMRSITPMQIGAIVNTPKK